MNMNMGYEISLAGGIVFTSMCADILPLTCCGTIFFVEKQYVLGVSIHT